MNYEQKLNKVTQYFSDDYLEGCKNATPEQIIQFVENFRELQSSATREKSKMKLISMKIPHSLLESFRFLSEAKGIPYQTQIKKLMQSWIDSGAGKKE